MKKNQNTNSDMKYFDDEERKLIESFENSDVAVKPISSAAKKKWQKIAADSIAARKKRALSVRLGERDIDRIKQKAARKGLPYQTLIASVIHQYATDQLEEK